MNQYFVPHPALYGITSPPAPKPPAPAPISPYQQLKDLDELLNLEQAKVSQAKSSYTKTLEQFASLCHELWQKEKAQGNREGKGFRRQLQESGIDAARAYRAMKKFFPADFPARKKRETATLFAANKVANPMPFLRFTSQIPACRGRRRPSRTASGSAEVLELAFALTPQEKTEFLRCLKVVGPEELKQLLLQAMKQAAEATRSRQQTSGERPEALEAPSRKPPRSDNGDLCPMPRKDSSKTATRKSHRVVPSDHPITGDPP